jgi:predicted Fe-Mo cluster-binding NifX family protein
MSDIEQKVAVAANDDCSVADSADAPPLVVVYDMKGRDVVFRTIRYYDNSLIEAVNDCKMVIGKSFGDAMKTDLASRGIEARVTTVESADEAVGQVFGIKRGDSKVEMKIQH